MSLSPPSVLQLTFLVGFPLFVLYSFAEIRRRRRPSLSNFLEAGFACLFNTTAIVLGTSTAFYGVTGDLLPGLTFDEMRPLLAIIGGSISLAFLFLSGKELKTRMSRHK